MVAPVGRKLCQWEVRNEGEAKMSHFQSKEQQQALKLQLPAQAYDLWEWRSKAVAMMGDANCVLGCVQNGPGACGASGATLAGGGGAQDKCNSPDCGVRPSRKPNSL